MKNTFLKIITCLVIISAIGCKKDKLGNECLITSITPNDIVAQKATITYDNQNRISEYIKDGSKYKFVYNGLSGKMQTYLADTLYRADNLTFDNNGRLTSFEEYLNLGGNLLRYYYIFTYDANGYLFTTIQTLTGDSYDSYYKDSLLYSNGNLTKKITKRVNGTTSQTIDYSYGSIANKTWNYYWNYFTEPFSILSGYTHLYPLLGKPSTNLPSSIVVTNGTFIDNYSYVYSLNDNDFVTEYNEMRSNAASGNTSANYKLTYSCD